MDSQQHFYKASDNEKAQKAILRQKKFEENTQTKIEKYGYQQQVQMLVSQGFSDLRSIVKALKKSKGDVKQATQILEVFENEQITNDEQIAMKKSVIQDKRKFKVEKQMRDLNIPDQLQQELQNSDSNQKHERRNKNNRCENEPKVFRNRKHLVNKQEDEENKSKIFTNMNKQQFILKQIKGNFDVLSDEQQEKVKTLLGSSHDSIKNQFRDEEQNAQFDSFQLFHKEMQKKGFSDKRKNFQAFKKFSGDSNLALQQLERKKQRGQLKFVENLEKGKFSKIYLDCDNCFYLEKCFSKFAIKGEFFVIEEKIATLMKVFQRNFQNVEVVLVFSDSQLLQNQRQISLFCNKNFQILSASPLFKSTKDLFAQILGAKSEEANEKNLFITSNRMLQSLLIEKKVKSLMESQRFFKILQDDVIGIEEYASILCI